MKKKTIIILALLVSAITISLTTYSVFRKNASTSTDVATAEFTYSITAVELSLKDSITNSFPLAPGAEGEVQLNIDLTGADVSIDYLIEISRNGIPTNLKFYSDSARTTEISQIQGSYSLGTSTSKSHTIYWKWLVVDTATGNLNDSQYMNSNITLTLNSTFSQQIGGGN